MRAQHQIEQVNLLSENNQVANLQLVSLFKNQDSVYEQSPYVYLLRLAN